MASENVWTSFKIKEKNKENFKENIYILNNIYGFIPNVVLKYNFNIFMEEGAMKTEVPGVHEGHNVTAHGRSER